MKKVLLLFSLFIYFCIGLSAVAYETIVIDFPPRTKWVAAYYKHIGTEAILQYIPDWQTYDDWKQCIIVHSYKDNLMPASQLSDMLIAQMEVQNPTAAYRYLRYTGVDAIAVRMTNDYKGIKGHGEIFRTTKCAEGRMTIQYIDRDKENFKRSYGYWLKVIREARTYNSYWRDDRIMNKSDRYEL